MRDCESAAVQWQDFWKWFFTIPHPKRVDEQEEAFSLEKWRSVWRKRKIPLHINKKHAIGWVLNP
jgi:hypothetical protein